MKIKAYQPLFQRTFSIGLKELKEANVVYTCDKSKHTYKFNKVEKLNQLLLTIVKHLGLINEGSSVDLDFDHQFIPAHKYDATYSYKGDYGYFPGWVHLPFSFLEQNTVFMLVTVMLKKFILHTSSTYLPNGLRQEGDTS